MRLVQYPFVVVRFRCNLCKRGGASRLARLADRFGCEATLDQVMEKMTRDCPWRDDNRVSQNGCGIHLPDLPARVPPDLPPGMRRLRIVKSATG
jgi:hypothetical protein